MPKTKIYFATTNDFKVAEVQAILRDYDIIVEKLALEKTEDKEKGVEEVAVGNAERFARKFNVPVVVEDTGFYFHAYPNFPGANPKLMFNLIGYKGLLKLLEGEQDRGAEFRSAVAYSDGKETKLFAGRLVGTVPEKPEGTGENVMPYERIFTVTGHDKVIAFLSREEKNKISHRSKAFRELAEWLTGKKQTQQPSESKEEAAEKEASGTESNGDVY